MKDRIKVVIGELKQKISEKSEKLRRHGARGYQYRRKKNFDAPKKHFIKSLVEKKDLHKFHLRQKKQKNFGVNSGTILSHIKSKEDPEWLKEVKL